MKPTRECIYPGVGRLYKVDGAWYWETVTGKKGGPNKDKDCAMHSMDTNWRTDMRERAGITQYADGSRYPMPDVEKMDPRSRRYDPSIQLSWQQARILVCRRWGA